MQNRHGMPSALSALLVMALLFSGCLGGGVTRLPGYQSYEEQHVLTQDKELTIVLNPVSASLVTLGPSEQTQSGDEGAPETVAIWYSSSSNAHKSAGRVRIEHKGGRSRSGS